MSDAGTARNRPGTPGEGLRSSIAPAAEKTGTCGLAAASSDSAAAADYTWAYRGGRRRWQQAGAGLAPGTTARLAGLQRVAAPASARLDGVPAAMLAYAGAVGCTDEARRGDDPDDRAEEVELEDVAGSERARDESSDQRAGDPEQHGEPSADPLASGQHEPRDQANDDADDNETKDLHGTLVTARAGVETTAGRAVWAEAERYREAAELALDQLQWCIDCARSRRRLPGLGPGSWALRSRRFIPRMKELSQQGDLRRAGYAHGERRSKDGDPGED